MPQNNDNITNESSPQIVEVANEEVQPSEIGFSDLQLDQCIQKDFLTASPFCPTCIIDENATPDDWRAPEYDEEVYLDKTKCEYVAVVEVKLGNILSSDVSPEEFLDEELQELSSKYVSEAYEKYIEENPESELTFLQFFERGTPEIKNLYDEAVRKARDELQKSVMDSTGYITDTKNGKKQVNAFKNLLDWARDPDRIRIGIKSILDENDKLNNNKTVCAFGGCQYSMDDVVENREMIDTYLKGLFSSAESLNNAISNDYANRGVGQDIAAGILEGTVGYAAYLISTPFAWLADNISHKTATEKQAARRFDGMLTGFFNSDIKNSLQRLQSVFGSVNYYALEWYAYVPDDGVYLLPDSDILRYTVRIPAFNVDLLPPAADEDKDDEESDISAEIELENTDWRVKFTEMKTGLFLMKYEYDIYRIKHGGSIIFDQEGATSFDMLEFQGIIDSLKNFKKELEILLSKNNMAFSYQKSNPFTFLEYFFHKTVTSVRIEIAKSEELLFGKEALEIAGVYVTIEGCPEVKLTTKNIVSFNKKDDNTEGSIKKEKESETPDQEAVSNVNEGNIIYKKAKGLNKFIRRVSGTRNDHTMLFLLSKMSTALMGFQAQEKVKITDWAKDFIFPNTTATEQIPIGSTGNDKSALGCILENFPLMSAESWSSILDDLIVGTWDVFRDELRKRMCDTTGKYVDPGMQRWFATQEVQDLSNDAYEKTKEALINAQKKRIEEAIKDAKRAQRQTSGGIWGDYNRAQQAERADNVTEDRLLESAALEVADSIQEEQNFDDGQAQFAALQPVVDFVDGGEVEDENRWGLEIDLIPLEVLQSEEKLEAWAAAQLEKSMPAIKSESRNIGKAIGDLKKSEHPYADDIKESVLQQFDYENSLMKKFKDFFTGNNLTKPEDEQERFFEYLSDIGLCGLILGLKKALGCLFGQIDLESIIKKVVTSIFGGLRIDQFVYFMTELLPVDQQLEVQAKIQKKIDDMFKGTVINLQSSDILDPSLYQTRKPKAEADPKLEMLHSTLGFGAEGVAKASTKVGSLIRSKVPTKHDRLQKKYDKTIEKAEKAGLEGESEESKKLFKKANKIRLKMRRLSAIADKKEKRKKEKAKLREKGTYPKQGSIGQASAEIAGIILKAYIDSFLDLDLSSTKMLDLVRQLPVISSIPDFVFDMITCPRKTIVDPPIKDIIKFNFKKPNFCDPTRPMISFNFDGIHWPFKNPWKFLRDAFVAALSKVLTQILIKIVVQFLVEFEKMLCKMLGALGKAGLNAVTGDFDESPLLDAFREAYCGENASDDEVKKAMAGVMATTGITSPAEAGDFARKMTGAFAGNFTKDEVMRVIFQPKGNPALIQRVKNVIEVTVPELLVFFDPPNVAESFFEGMANTLPRDHKENIRNALDEFPLPNNPVFDTICLTDNELDAWYNAQQGNLEERGLSPQDSRDMILVWRDRTIQIIDEFLEISDPENLEARIAEMLVPTGGRDPFGDPDPNQLPPGCEDAESRAKINSLVDEPEELVKLSNGFIDRAFRTVDAFFTKELFAGNDALLGRILSDTYGNSFARHGFYRNFFITRHVIYDNEAQKENDKGINLLPPFIKKGGYFPNTVGLYLFEEITKEFSFSSVGMDDFGGKGKVKGTYNPFGLAPELSFNYKINRYEKAEATMKYQIPVVIDGWISSPEDMTGKKPYDKWKNSVSYASQVLIPKPLMNFDYRIRVDDALNPFLITGDMRTGANDRYNIHVHQETSSEVEEYLLDLVPSENQKYRKSAFDFTMNKIFKEYFPSSELKISQSDYDAMISKVLNIFRDICLDIIPRDGQEGPVEVTVIDDKGKATEEKKNVTVPSGFLFGYENTDFEEDERIYVGPDGEEYEYEEEEQVLGKMKKFNPRIHILDPKKYGGSYKRPPWYVEDPDFKGWLHMAKVLAPDISGCKPSQQNILQINQVMSHVKKAKNKMKVNPKLFSGRGDCFYHIPFDRLIDKESKATIEGCIKTIIRINVIEQLIGALPVMGFVEYNDNNFGAAFSNLVAKRIQQDLSTTNVGLFPRKIEKQNYWLSFLEQAVEMYWRMWESQQLDYKNDDGEEELPEHIDDIFTDLRTLQEEYNWVSGMWRNPRSAQGVKSDGGLLGDRSNRRIEMPGYYYDFDNQKFRDINTSVEPIYDGTVGPFDISRQEYLDADDKVYSEDIARENGGAFIEYPTAAEIELYAEQYTAETYDDPNSDTPSQGEQLFNWRNPPPTYNGLEVKFARYDLNQVGTQEVPLTKPIIDIVGPLPATQQEYTLGKDLDPNLPDNVESDDLARRSSEAIAAANGGIVEVGMQSNPFGPASGREYVKYRRIVVGQEPLYKVHDPFDFQQQYAHYCALAYQMYGDSILYSNDKLTFGESITFGPLDSSWQFASCMWAVRSVQDKCMLILAELVSIELKQIMDLFKDKWKPQLLDINRYLLNTDLFVDNGLKNFGTRDHEERVAMGSIPEMGEVADVVVDPSVESSFGDTESDMPIKFKIEKYIRVTERDNRLDLSNGVPVNITIPEVFANRDDTLKGVVNVEHFQQFINSTKEEYGEYFISDLFGDAIATYSFKFEEVFGILYQHVSPNGNANTPDNLYAKLREVEINNSSSNAAYTNQTSADGISITPPNPIAYVQFFDKYSVILTENQKLAFESGTLEINLPDNESSASSDGSPRTIKYEDIHLPKDLVIEEWFVTALLASKNKVKLKPSGMNGSIGLKYGIRIVANLPPGSGVPTPTQQKIKNSNSVLEKCFYMNTNDISNYENNFSLPICFAEVDVIDHKLKEFNWKVEGGESAYPMDIDCLLRKLLETPEYQIIFKHVMNPSAVTSMCAILSATSFESSIGYKDGWEKVIEADPDGEEEDGPIKFDDDDWQRKYFQNTRMLVRRMFSGYYLKDDFEDPDIEAFDFSLIFKAAFGSITGWMKKGFAGFSAWWRTNLQPNPYDADGEECKSEYEKLL